MEREKRLREAKPYIASDLARNSQKKYLSRSRTTYHKKESEKSLKVTKSRKSNFEDQP